MLPPPRLSVLAKLSETYRKWHEFVPHFPKDSRYTLGAKIDLLFIEILESIVIASYLGKKEKYPYTFKASTKLDVLKFFLQTAWEIKAIDNKQYIILSERLDEIGRMLGGWQKQIIKENSAEIGGERRQ